MGAWPKKAARGNWETLANNAPSTWAWGNNAREPHAVVMFFGEPAQFESFVQSAKGNAWRDAFDEIASLATSDLDGVEPFGFTDGISQPQIDWQRNRDVTSPQLDYTNVVALGEFLLGYPNEYNKYTDRPLLEAASTSADLLRAEDAPDKKDLGRNGTYLVMRQLQQDVRGFWQFVHRASGESAAEAETLAASFVGRKRGWHPLVPMQKQAIPGIDQSDPKQVSKNQFTYVRECDGCPLSFRRAHPSHKSA